VAAGTGRGGAVAADKGERLLGKKIKELFSFINSGRWVILSRSYPSHEREAGGGLL
jgi:hypothetical protein